MGQFSSWLLRPVFYAASLALPTLTAYLIFRAAATHLRARQTDADLTRHRYVLGTTGSGKTRGCAAFLLDDLRRGHACVWVTTHGARDILSYLPDGTDTRYFHPFRGKGINLLRRYTNTPYEDAVLASQCVTVFQRLFGESMGQAMCEIALAGALALLEEGRKQYREVTLLDLYRRMKADDMDPENQIVADQLLNKDQRSAKAMLRRLAGSLSNPIVLRCLSATGGNGLDLSELIAPDHPFCVVCDIDRNEIAPGSAELIAHILSSQLELVLSARRGNERQVSVFLDECQTYAHSGLAQAIEEGRKRKVCWTFAHQMRNHLPERLRFALELCGSQYFFRCIPADAKYAASYIGKKEWTWQRFVNLPNRRYIAKELCHDRQRTYTARTRTIASRRVVELPSISEPAQATEKPTHGILVRQIAGKMDRGGKTA